MIKNKFNNGQDGFPSLCIQINKIYNIDPTAIYDIPENPVDCSKQNLIKFINYLQVCMQNHCNINDKFLLQFYPMHNHDDYKVTNNGVYLGGQLTLIEIDAPDGMCRN